MDEKELFCLALGMEKPWEVVRIDFNAESKKLDIVFDFPRGSQFACPECGEMYPAYDTAERSWRHLNFFEHLCYLHAFQPRVKCEKHGVRTAHVPWARPQSGFTLLFEALILTFGRNGMTPNAIGRIVGEHDTRIWRLLEYYVDDSREKEDYSEVTQVGIDETSRAKGHSYVTLFADIEESKVIFVTAGKDHQTVKAFREDLEAHGGAAKNISDFSLDMSKAFIKGIREEFVDAYLTFDKFHIMKLVNEAVDDVRKAEQKDHPELKKTRIIWLKNETNHTAKQSAIFAELKDSTLKTARARRIRDTLQAMFGLPIELAEGTFKRWYFWATHSRLAPFIKLAKTLKAHKEGIMRWFESRITNGLMEGFNSLVQAAKVRARGYRSTRKMIVTIYLIAGKLNFDLPNALPRATHTK